MARKARYPEKVIGYVLAQRGNRARWKEIKDGIIQEFGIKPPSERQMRDWYKQWSVGSVTQEKTVTQTLADVARAYTPAAAFDMQQFTIQRVIPAFVEAQRQNKDVRLVGAKMMLAMLEQIVGDEIYEIANKEYEQERQARPKTIRIIGLVNQPYPPHGWSLEAVTEEESKKEQL